MHKSGSMGCLVQSKLFGISEQLEYSCILSINLPAYPKILCKQGDLYYLIMIFGKRFLIAAFSELLISPFILKRSMVSLSIHFGRTTFPVRNTQLARSTGVSFAKPNRGSASSVREAVSRASNLASNRICATGAGLSPWKVLQETQTTTHHHSPAHDPLTDLSWDPQRPNPTCAQRPDAAPRKLRKKWNGSRHSIQICRSPRPPSPQR